MFCISTNSSPAKNSSHLRPPRLSLALHAPTACTLLLARRALAPRPGAAETVPAIPHNLGCSSPSAYARARNISPDRNSLPRRPVPVLVDAIGLRSRCRGAGRSATTPGGRQRCCSSLPRPSGRPNACFFAPSLPVARRQRSLLVARSRTRRRHVPVPSV